jgi:hypothetical protein
MSIVFLIYIYILCNILYITYLDYISKEIVFLKCLTCGFEILDFLSLNVKLYHYFKN